MHVWPPLTLASVTLGLVFTCSELHAAPAEAFALVVGNNKSLKPGQPDLHYADDDAVKWTLLFSSVAAPDDVVLLTRLDQESADQHHGDVTPNGPPTLAALHQATQTLAHRVASARAQGRSTVFYFVRVR